MKVRTVLPVVLLLCMISMPSEAQVQDWASPGNGGDAGNGDSGTETTSRAISADGRFVVFDSFADERSRPFFDLVRAVPAEQARRLLVDSPIVGE